MNLKFIYTLFLAVLGINSSSVAGDRENLPEPNQVNVVIEIKNSSTFNSRSFLEEKLPLPNRGTEEWFKSRVQTDHYYLHFVGNDPNDLCFNNARHQDFIIPPLGDTYPYCLWIRPAQLKNLSVAFWYKQDKSPTYSDGLLNLFSMSLTEFESKTFNVPVDLTLPEPLEVKDEIVQDSNPQQKKGPIANIRFIYEDPLSLFLKSLRRALDDKVHLDITFVTGMTP